MADLDRETRSPQEIFDSQELIDAIAQTISDRLELSQIQTQSEAEIIDCISYPRYGFLIKFRQKLSAIAALLLSGAIFNVFYTPWSQFLNLQLHAFFSLATILSGVVLITLLVFEVFLGAGNDLEFKVKQGQKVRSEYRFVSSLNRLPFVLMFLGLGFFTIIFGFASLYTELLRQDPNNFQGLEEGFLTLYFSIVTFSTVGYGDVYPASFLARVAAICEIFIAMFFSLIALSTTLTWVTAYEHQETNIAIRDRIQNLQQKEKR
ncbi:MAG: potassium channel family protein [Jaaginema sp. PMC 1079.18]|nr:potassium channel family protein [Jaaginema sp. PMC 1080.18]MEC4849942.1 potassium channel family protein [Jaaginema sp. PMC 1079.18]MEC4865161.1 potassium channel family protein [Jaaginema sp. PMC 1078.18]